MRIGVFYGSTYGDTAGAAHRIARRLEERLGVPVPVRDVAEAPLVEFLNYEVLILGSSTWNIGELQEDWDRRFGELAALDLRGKRVALFGCGDQLGYPDTFQDALGLLAQGLEARGAELVGFWPAEGYEHTRSLAQRGDRFVGLALDELHQPHLSQARIEGWVDQVLAELGIAHEGSSPER